ncbi:uncharacterized protein L201_001077 [Kwoniella dendrophila CBS 6074]|uniref:Protein kinase domain-containing protein n=1 Tax=Kwoniella dendrophila CBS 6074 TaxID=1295534 RepID=A0AAX4JLC7_9TREE
MEKGAKDLPLRTRSQQVQVKEEHVEHVPENANQAEDIPRVKEEQVEQYPEHTKEAEDIPSWITKAVRIEITKSKDEFDEVGYHALGPEVHLPFHPAIPVDDLPRYPQPTIFARLGKLLGLGALWDVYQAEIYPDEEYEDEKCIKVFIKYTDCKDFDDESYYGNNYVTTLNLETALTGVKLEHEIYTQTFRDLQGTVIPKHYGTFIDIDDKSCAMIIEDVGTQLGAEGTVGHVAPEDKEKIQMIFEIIHSKKVLHGGARHAEFYKAANGEVKITDFHIATPDAPDFQLAWEKYEVKRVCGLVKRMSYRDFVNNFNENEQTKHAFETDVKAEKPLKRIKAND